MEFLIVFLLLFIGTSETQVEVSKAVPGTRYEVTISSISAATYSSPISRTVTTNVTTPGKVVNLTVEAFNYSAVNLIWYLPQQPNGKITSFKISVKHARSGIVVKDVSIKVEDILTGKLPESGERVGSAGILLSWNTPPNPNGRIISYIVKYKEVCPWMQTVYTQVRAKPDSLEVLLTNLHPGTTYEIKVAAENSAGVGVFSDPFLFQTAESVIDEKLWKYYTNTLPKIILENNESFLWSTTSPSPTLGRVTPPSRTTYSSSTLARSKISSVWKEPISFVVTHLRPYTTYLFEVSAVTTEAGYIDSTIVRTPESVPEGPPQNCVTGNITGKSFSISWDPPTIITGKFSYRVELYGPLVPGAISDLQLAEVEATQIRITWKKPRQPNGIINQYRVKVLVSATGKILEDTLLTGKNEYINDPMAPEIVNIEEPMAGLYEGSAEMSSDLYSLASFMYNSHPYNIFPARNGAEDQNSPVVTTRNQYITDIDAEQLSYVIRRLIPFTEHMISVSAFTIMGEGPPTVLNVRTHEQVPSSIQIINYKNISSSSILLYWDPPEYPNGKITHYTIYAMELDTNRAFQMTTIDNSFLITGLKKYTKYKMRVAASTHVGESSLSEENDIFVRTPEDEPESSPQDLEVIDITSNEIRLKWSPPEKPNGIIIAYEVLYKDIDTLFIKNTSTTNIILKDLKPYTLYNISVRSYTRFGHGNQLSSLLSVRTSETVPDSAPENITYQNISSGEIELSFLPPSSPNGIIQKYTIYLKRSNGNEERTINTTSLTQNIKGLKKYTQYLIEVSASTLKGEGVRSAPISVLTEEDAPDSPPQDFSVKQLSGVTVKLSWQPPLEPNGIILYYTVYVWAVAPSDPPKDVHYVNLSSSSIILFWTPPSKPNGIIQYYSVYYRNTSGMPLAPPQNLTLINYTSDFVWLKWSPSPLPGGIVKVYSFKIHEHETDTVFYKNISGFQTEAKLVGLNPVSTYSISVSAFTKVGNGNQFSNIVKFTTQESVPDVVQNIQCVATSWQSVLVKWNSPKKANGIITHYMITVERNSTKVSPQDHMYTFTKLLANTSYVFKVRASTSAGEGDESTCHVSTLPETVPSVPTNITFSDVQSTSATLTWIRPDTILGYFQNYKITTQLRAQKCREWESEECVEYQNIQYLYEADLTEETVYGLKKFRWYRFQVAASTNAGYGNASSWISTQTLPGRKYCLNMYIFISVDNDEFNITLIKSNEENKTIEVKDLKIFTKYSVVITAFTGNMSAAYVEGKSSAEVIVTTLESAPKDPPNNMTFQKIPDEVTKFQLTFLPPSQPNGNIQVYQALVYREDDPTAVQIRNLSIIQKTDTSVIAVLEGLKGGHTYNISWQTSPAQPKTKPIPIYDATGKLLVTSTTITIRMPICYYSDDHGPIKYVQVLVAETGAQHDGNVTKWYDAYFNKARPYFTNEGFPNPPCTEGKTKFSGNEEIYVIGADNACMIRGNEDKICNGPLKPKKQYLFKFRATNIMGQFTDSDYSDPVKTLGEGLSERTVEIILSVTLCILSIILLGTAIFAFARIRQKQKEGGTYSPRDAEIIDTKFKLDQLITVADLELKDERLTRLLSYRKSIKPISKKSFLQHVEELCTNNNLKFQEEFSGYLCPNEFIATQGPLPGTVGDFWRMVWETRAKTLVMLTQCFEKGRIRCHQYWPEDNKPVTVFGDIVITKLMEDVQIDWTIRDLKIERHGDYMTVRQCNFTAWPEHGVPENSAPLIHFVKLIRASRAHDTTPMIVHCSAGVGRTGVFIALDHLTQHINDHDFVDIYGLVAELRSERMCMVQNLAQYIFLHQCILDLLSNKGSNQPICFVNYSALQKMDSLDAMEGDVELEWEETTM
ncbi:PREDICTED: phosphatidylinositol phosphatase PTPRQ [Propithecus coquereli]|uniref:phosphatidylinositol phosphatase PTPRQ n=1 Tax=Propithecus coquereli TaxID=379532 RepID=UPI00063F4C02|nr:PREDICTED: phosphatidylinositol phosphatase PTPRQ [Propithecus coquereli]